MIYSQDPDRKKSKSEVMKEIIAKSKFHKAERQRLKDDNEVLIEDVDAELDDIRTLLSLPTQQQKFEKYTKDSSDYDFIVKELANEKRARPSDRLKTDVELAIEEKRRLDELEANRLSRMNDTIEKSPRRIPQADDLEDYGIELEEEDTGLQYDDDGVLVAGSFSMNLKRKKNQESSNEESEGVSEDESELASEDEFEGDKEESKGVSGDESELASGDEFEGDKEESKGESGESETESIADKESVINEDSSLENTIPFVIQAPKEYSELADLFLNRSSNQCDLILVRIRAYHSDKIAVGNKQKLKTLLKLLLMHLKKTCDKNQSRIDLEMLNVLLTHIHALIQVFPDYSCNYFQDQIKKLHERLKSQGLEKIQRTFPTTSGLIFIELLGNTYSTSDFEHSIVTPAMILCSEYLTQCFITQSTDAFRGFYICKILFKVYLI